MKSKRVSRQSDRLNFNRALTQSEFAEITGVSQQDVSRLIHFNVLRPGGTGKEWMQQYLRFQFGIIYARKGWQGLERAFG